MHAFLIRSEPDRNMHRYYQIDVQQTLFGDFVTVRRWGRIGTDGQLQQDWHDTQEAADGAAALLVKRKENRGYIRVA